MSMELVLLHVQPLSLIIMVNLNWFEVILPEEGDWWKFNSYEEAHSAYLELLSQNEDFGENYQVELVKPAPDWTEDNLSYLTILDSWID